LVLVEEDAAGKLKSWREVAKEGIDEEDWDCGLMFGELEFELEVNSMLGIDQKL